MPEHKIGWLNIPGYTPVTWNPITGCTPASEGCAHCYAKRMAQRLAGRYGYPKDEPFRPGTVHLDKLSEPLHWRKQRAVFVCSMGDLFHEDVAFSAIDRVVGTMAQCPQHIFMLLTKRPLRMEAYISDLQSVEGALRFENQLSYPMRLHKAAMAFRRGEFLPNAWLGVTVENQDQDWRVRELLRIPAAVRFASVEPCLSFVNVERYAPTYSCHDCGYVGNDIGAETDPEVDEVKCPRCGTSEDGAFGFANCDETPRLDWLIAGAESGPGARPMDPEWVRSLRDQCVAAGTPYFFKSWGKHVPKDQTQHTLDGETWRQWPTEGGTPCA